MTRQRPDETAFETLRRLAARFRHEAVSRGLRANAILLLVLGTGLLYTDALLQPRAEILILLWLLAASVQAGFLLFRVGVPARRRPDPEALARRLERRIPAFSGRLMAAVEGGATPADPHRGYSEVLRDAAFDRAAMLLEQTQETGVRRRLGIPEPRGGSVAARTAAVACAGLLAAGLLLEIPVSLRGTIGRVGHPLALYRAERTWDLEVDPGDAARMAGEDLSVRVRSRRGETVMGPRIRTVAPDGTVDVRAMEPLEGGTFEAQFEGLGAGFRYRILEGRRRSPEYVVTVEAWPGITDMTFDVVPPHYTDLAPSRSGGERGVIFAPVGSVVGISGHASKDLQSVEVLFSRGKTAVLPVVGARGFRGEFPVAESDSFRVVPVDRAGHRGEGGRVYALGAVRDRRPEVRLLRPEADRDIDRSLQEVLRFEAGDDYGLGDLCIEYVVETRGGEQKSRGTITAARFAPGRTDTTIDYAWDLRALGLAPGDRVRFQGRLRDNDPITGPKGDTTGTRRLTLPTVGEIFARRGREIGETEEDVAGVVEEAGRLRRSIELLEQEMKAAGGADWEGRNAAAEVSRRQWEILQRLRSAAERFDRSAGEMREDGGLSPELLRRVEEVSRLFQDVATPEMIAAMEALRRALDRVDPAAVERALRALNLSEETFRRGLEKTWRALRRLQAEQRLEALARMAGEIHDRQEALNRTLDGDRPADAGESRREEESIAGDTERLEGLLGAAPEEMRSAGVEGAAGELERLAEEMTALDLPAGMREIGAMITTGGTKASSRGREVAADLEEVRRRLDTIREGLRERWRRETEEAIDGAIENLLVLSRAEEILAARAPSPGESGEGVDAFLEEQGVLTEGLEGVADALLRSSEETYYIGREVGTRIGEALARMRRSARRLESSGRGDAAAAADAREALRGLNGALLALIRDRAAMREAESGIGFEEAFRRMMALARSQAALNERAGGMFPLPMPGAGEAPGSEFLRMAAEQRRIREGLEAVRETLEEGGGGLGRLDEVEREMEAVERDLAAGSLRKESLERQRRILSRMLDAQRSLRRREDSSRREAQAPRPYRPVPPPALSGGAAGERGDDRLPPAASAYPEGYREAIRSYRVRMSGRRDEEAVE